MKAAFVASALKDPSSVQFEEVQENSDVICGEYNAKNGFGAYTGYESFVFDRKSKQLWLTDDGANNAPPNIFAECTNASDLISKDLGRLEADIKRENDK